MTRRWWVALLAILVVVMAAVAAASRLPELVRRVAIARIHAATGRPVDIAHVNLSLLRGRASIQGLRLAERDGRPFAAVERLDVALRLPWLLVGHVRLRELSIR